MPESIPVLRASLDRYRALLEPMSETEVTAPSYDDGWTTADVASHLGSGAEIFSAFLDAGIAAEEPPGQEAFSAVWDRWNATPPVEQVHNSLASNETLVGRLESLTPEQRDAFGVSMFGMQVGISMLAGMRIGETTFHTWDIAVMKDPAATLAPDAVPLMLDNISGMMERAMRQVEGGGTVTVATSDPERRFVLDLETSSLLSESAEGTAAATMPAEAFLRLVAGRLDADHTPASVTADEMVLANLRQAFPGF